MTFDKRPVVTVFTPSFNRAYILPQLYESLKHQECKAFEWIIVDDGSTDNTRELIRDFEREGLVNIRFACQSNGGKHLAINRGVEMAHGELFIIVDSDDYLTPDAIKWIIDTARPIMGNEDFAGLSGIRITPVGEKIGGGCDFGTVDANALDIRFRHGVEGDLAEIYKTEILKQYPFPSVNGEKFCPEALVWNRIATRYMLRYCHKGIYVCEYLPDGLTAKITKLRMKSAVTSTMYYSELVKMDIPLAQKIKGAINYWRFWFCRSSQRKPSIGAKWWWTLPVGLLMNINDRRKL